MKSGRPHQHSDTLRPMQQIAPISRLKINLPGHIVRVLEDWTYNEIKAWRYDIRMSETAGRNIDRLGEEMSEKRDRLPEL